MGGPDSVLGFTTTSSEDEGMRDLESSMDRSIVDDVQASREALKYLGNSLLDQRGPSSSIWQQQYNIQPTGELLTVIGIDDSDLSTIANDTYNGSSFNGHFVDTIPVNPPIMIQKQERRSHRTKTTTTTPEKRYPPLSPDVTLPETPPPSAKRGQRSSPSGTNTTSSPRSNQHHQPYPSTHKEEYPILLSSRLGRMTCAASILGFILLGAVGLLSFSFFHMRRVDPSGSSLGFLPKRDNDLNEKEPEDLGEIVLESTKSPFRMTLSPTVSPTIRTSRPTKMKVEPTLPPAARITSEPTAAFNQTEFQDLVNSLRDTILQVSPEADQFLDVNLTSMSGNNYTTVSLPYRALEWLASDPQLANYSDAQIFQRWVLSSFFLTVSLPPTIATTAIAVVNTTAEEFPPPLRLLVGSESLSSQYSTTRGMGDFEGSAVSDWMSYTHECNWYSTEEQNWSCDTNGTIRGIYLENFKLQGSLPKELSLLSNSLEFLYLSQNIEMVGSIPAEYGALTKLVRLRIEKSGITGSIPYEIGYMSNLRLLALGRNRIGGVVPPELGALTRLRTLALGENDLTGTIPTELGLLVDLAFLSFKDNGNINGTIPLELGNCTKLKALLLGGTGIQDYEVPQEICGIGPFDRLEVDCEIPCNCCTNNCTTAAPSLPPVMRFDPALVDSSPQCNNSTITARKTCFATGEVMELDMYTCDYQQFDVLGMYQNSTEAFDNGEAVFFLRSCGEQACHGIVQDSFLTFDNKDPVRLSAPWPLPPGDYSFVLSRVGFSGELVAHVTSEPFQIKEVC